MLLQESSTQPTERLDLGSDLPIDSELDVAPEGELDTASDPELDTACGGEINLKLEPDPTPNSGSGRRKWGQSILDLSSAWPSVLTARVIQVLKEQPDKFLNAAASETSTNCFILSSIHQSIVANEREKDAAVIRLRFFYHAFCTNAKLLGYHAGVKWRRGGSQSIGERGKNGHVLKTERYKATIPTLAVMPGRDSIY